MTFLKVITSNKFFLEVKRHNLVPMVWGIFTLVAHYCDDIIQRSGVAW